jgi:rubrerythrin
VSELSRKDVLRAGLLAGCGTAAGAALLAGLPQGATSKPSKKQDAEILNAALVLEALQGAFYADALERASLTGELREFAEEVGGQEREHEELLRQALGSAADDVPDFDFGDTTASAKAFRQAAIELEDLVVQAYNAQAPNLTKEALAAAATIVSVEARHAAWIRDLAGKNPAPFASEPQKSPKAINQALNDTGFIK